MKSDYADGFERLLAALEQELIAATDEEILDAAGDLGMNPLMKGSSAFFGVTVGARPSLRQADPKEPSDTPGLRRRGKDDPPPG